jgi:predicted RNA binding protein YcfA (HicA-like mRNA interferase family)
VAHRKNTDRCGFSKLASEPTTPDDARSPSRKTHQRPSYPVERRALATAHLQKGIYVPILPEPGARRPPLYIIHSTRATTMRSRKVIEALEWAGWKQVRQKGSHVQFKHPQRRGLVTVPHPNPDIPIGTLRSIEKQSGLKLR